MIVQRNFINKLRDFGLNSYESKLWTALLSRGISTAGELSDIASVPRSRSYDVLESLEKKGFIIMKIGKPIKYIAVHPEEVLKRVKKKIQEDAEFKSKLMDQLEKSEVLTELTTLHTKGLNLIEPGELTGAFKGRENIYQHIAFSIRNANKSILLLTTNEGLQRKSEYLLSPLMKAKSRGVKIVFGVTDLNKNNKALSRLEKIGEIKNSDLDGRMVVIDGKDVIFMLLDDEKTQDHYDVGVWIRSPYLGATIHKMLDSHIK